MNKWMIISACMVLGLVLVGCAVKGVEAVNKNIGKNSIVGDGITIDKVKEFYYTVDKSTNPAFYQRYHFYKEDDKYMFFHDTREGDAWPLTEEYSTASGTVELSEEEWKEFFDFLSGGEVSKRNENTNSGGGGPFLFLYWDGDKGTKQQYEFEDYEKRTAFESFCENLSERE